MIKPWMIFVAAWWVVQVFFIGLYFIIGNDPLLWITWGWFYVGVYIGIFSLVWWLLAEEGAKETAKVINAKIKNYASSLDDPNEQKTGARSS